jgi:hypothetical protein
MSLFEAGKVQDIAAILGLIVTTLGLMITLIIFLIQQRQLVKVQKRDTYQRLELASNEVFRFAADNAAVLARYDGMKPDPSIDFEKTVVENAIADSYIYQTLNLFEMAARFRKDKFFDDEIFGSWVIWYYAVLGSWYFRRTWEETKHNYTSEMRRVFDRPAKQFDQEPDDAKRKRNFFAHVARELNCPLVRTWLDR